MQRTQILRTLMRGAAEQVDFQMALVARHIEGAFRGDQIGAKFLDTTARAFTHADRPDAAAPKDLSDRSGSLAGNRHPGNEVVERITHMVGRSRHQLAAEAPYLREVLERLVTDAKSRGILTRIIDPENSRINSYRIIGGFRSLAARGRAPELARFFPTAKGPPAHAPIEQMWPVFEDALDRHRNELATYINRRGVAQANIPERACALYPGLLHITHKTGQPLTLLETGSSGGLLLHMDRFGYAPSDIQHIYGNAEESELIFGNAWSGLPKNVADTPLQIMERRGCDLNPHDVTTPRGRADLIVATGSFDPPTIAQQEAAMRVASKYQDVRIERGDAIQWLRDSLTEPRPDTTTVVMSSMFHGFLSSQQRADFDEVIRDAVRSAPESNIAEVQLRRPSNWKFDPDNPTYPTELAIITHRPDAATEEIFPVHDRDGEKYRPDMSKPSIRVLTPETYGR
ncbi:DUF2332 domain-containing protein [Nocardia sp. NPDC004568]|uniref:DUF2332 domain-containing protein n=1 Tax=Nocardia sp. NPDC004568 TaxID=3154551 RepID=UPI0033A97124